LILFQFFLGQSAAWFDDPSHHQGLLCSMLFVFVNLQGC
jgi:hypothetical protein